MAVELGRRGFSLGFAMGGLSALGRFAHQSLLPQGSHGFQGYRSHTVGFDAAWLLVGPSQGYEALFKGSPKWGDVPGQGLPEGRSLVLPGSFSYPPRGH